MTMTNHNTNTNNEEITMYDMYTPSWVKAPKTFWISADDEGNSTYDMKALTGADMNGLAELDLAYTIDAESSHFPSGLTVTVFDAEIKDLEDLYLAEDDDDEDMLEEIA